MVLLPHGPEPCASANSATSAFAVFLTRHTLFYTIFPKCQVFFVFLFSFIFSWLCRSFTVSPVHPSRARFFFFPLFPSPVPADPCPESPLPSVRKQDQADFRPEKQKACLLPSGKAKGLSPSGNRPFFIMQEEGLEPSWYCYHTDLNRARLPIPPLLHFFFIALALSLSDM